MYVKKARNELIKKNLIFNSPTCQCTLVDGQVGRWRRARSRVHCWIQFEIVSTNKRYFGSSIRFVRRRCLHFHYSYHLTNTTYQHSHLLYSILNTVAKFHWKSKATTAATSYYISQKIASKSDDRNCNEKWTRNKLWTRK